MKYGYVRVSTKEQNIDRQLADMYNLGLTDSNIFIDKQSGKDFDRTNYQKLKSILQDGDLLIIKSIAIYGLVIFELMMLGIHGDKNLPQE